MVSNGFKFTYNFCLLNNIVNLYIPDNGGTKSGRGCQTKWSGTLMGRDKILVRGGFVKILAVGEIPPVPSPPSTRGNPGQGVRNVSISEDFEKLSLWNFESFTLREKCPNTEFFLARIFLYSVRIQENKDQKKIRIWALSRSVKVDLFNMFYQFTS